MKRERCLVLFGTAVRHARESLGMSQEELAERCGLHRTYVGGVERGERNIGLRNVVRLAGALGLPPSRLVAATDEEAEV